MNDGFQNDRWLGINWALIGYIKMAQTNIEDLVSIKNFNGIKK